MENSVLKLRLLRLMSESSGVTASIAYREFIKSEVKEAFHFYVTNSALAEDNIEKIENLNNEDEFIKFAIDKDNQEIIDLLITYRNDLLLVLDALKEYVDEL